MPKPLFLQYETWILIHLCKKGYEKLYPAQIARDLGFPEVSVHRSLERLERKELVEMKKISRLKTYKPTDLGKGVAKEVMTEFPELLEIYTDRVNP